MANNRTVVMAGLLLCVAGVWLVVRQSGPDPTTTTGSVAGGDAALSSEHVEDPDLVEPIDPADVDHPVDGSADSVAERGEAAMGAELDSLQLQKIVPPTSTTTVQEESDCDRGYSGLGVEMRAWGDVLVPYTPGYPTTDPGEVWDCTAATVFGGAIAMAHAAYLEALRPDLIPAVALDTSGRDLRMNGHPGGNPSASLGFLCTPIGWNWDGDTTWSLLHQCGEGDLQVSYYPMEHRDGRWWLVYPRSGDIETGPPPPDYEYYPFLGGDR